jgi:hypothetical protein
MGWNRPKLTLRQILAWADAHQARTGRWPQSNSGPVRDGLADNWRSVENTLRLGLRGLPGGSSLAQLLEERQGFTGWVGPIGSPTMKRWPPAARVARRPPAGNC